MEVSGVHQHRDQSGSRRRLTATGLLRAPSLQRLRHPVCLGHWNAARIPPAKLVRWNAFQIIARWQSIFMSLPVSLALRVQAAGGLLASPALRSGKPLPLSCTIPGDDGCSREPERVIQLEHEQGRRGTRFTRAAGGTSRQRSRVSIEQAIGAGFASPTARNAQSGFRRRQRPERWEGRLIDSPAQDARRILQLQRERSCPENDQRFVAHSRWRVM